MTIRATQGNREQAPEISTVERGARFLLHAFIVRIHGFFLWKI
jgi:hypothetical protein